MWSIPLVTRFYRAAARQRFWMAGSALAVFLLTLVIGNHFLGTDKSVTRQMLGHDFLAFYTAGSFVRQGRTNDLYNLDAVRDFEQATAHAAGLEVGKSFGPWWNPPFYALVFEPLAALPYSQALDLWRWISIAAVILAISLLVSIVMRSSLATRWQQGLLVPLLIVTSMPFIQALSHGQNTFTSLLILTLTVTLWRGKRSFPAGCCCALLFYKPQLGAVVAAVMVLDLGSTALAGITLMGLVLLLITLTAIPGSLAAWVYGLPANVRWMQIEHAYLWERHVTLKAFWRLLLQGREAGEPMVITTVLTWLSEAVLGGGLLIAVLPKKVSKRALDCSIGWWTKAASLKEAAPQLNSCELSDHKLRRDRLIAATITTMPLLMPFYFDYDLLLLAVPAVLYASERISNPQRMTPADAWVTTRWVLLFVWLFFNPAFALHTHISGSVLLLSALSVCMIRRVHRADAGTVPILVIHPQRLALAA
jgi:hypothetical protein